ncbi:aminopeptidase P family protein [Candidatus Peregrinibacteria bacterium]|nr:aminopeptidase P family protein [Candidatus Peregrinibacteria bacterium]
MIKERQQFLKDLLKSQKLDIILVYSHYNDSTYGMLFTGIKPLLFHYFYMLPTKKGFFEISYLIPSIAHATSEKITPVTEDLMDREFEKLLKSYKRIGVIGNAPLLHFSKVKGKIVMLNEQVSHLLIQKSPEEVKKIRVAAKIAHNNMKKLSSFIKPGRTQIEIGKKLESLYFAEAEGLAFPTCVTTGPEIKETTASFPNSRKVQAKDIVCIDSGVIKDGFYSDCTRMYFLNNPEAEKNYKTFLKAHNEVIKQMKVGLPIREIPVIYKRELKKLGLPADTLEVQDLGHSIGFYVHEPPFLYSKAYDSFSICENMVFTLEPEIIFPKYKMRVEDMILVNKKGAENLTA